MSLAASVLLAVILLHVLVGGRNIDDLTSASEELLSSDNRSPEKQSSNKHKIAWSQGIENLIISTATTSNIDRYVFYLVGC